MPAVTGKCATIFISTGEETQVFRSVDEVPADLRQRLLESTQSVNSATILIADKRGREELLRALQGRSSEFQSRLVDSLRSRQTRGSAPPSQPSGLRSFRTWAEFLLPLAIGASLWFLIDAHF